MARPRVPTEKAMVSGAALVNAGRFKDRSAPKRKRPIGEPYVSMTEPQKAAWADMTGDMPWLTSAHRVLLRLACFHVARMEAEPEDFTVAATQALSALLSKLGATPVDESKVNHGDGDDESDPNDRHFGRPH